MKLTLKVWRQRSPRSPGRFETFEVDDISPDYSFLEMLDVLNERLEERGERPVAFEHDCREGICGSCGMMVNGEAHGPRARTTVCQLHMREFKDGDKIEIEPWRARSFPVLQDLVVDRGAFDRIIQAGGYISVSTGSAPEANLIPVEKEVADAAFDAATCIGCGACVAQCPKRRRATVHRGQDLSPQSSSAGKTGALAPSGEHGGADGGGGLWKLRKLPRVRSGLPQEHQHRLESRR